MERLALILEVSCIGVCKDLPRGGALLVVANAPQVVSTLMHDSMSAMVQRGFRSLP
jgi:hypothetical protein